PTASSPTGWISSRRRAEAPARPGRRARFSMMGRMRWNAHLAAALALVLAVLLHAGPGALPAHAQAQAPAAEAAPDVAELRAQLDRLPTSADTGEEARRLVREVDAIATGAQKFVAQRTGRLND